ncbi:MAG: nucleoside deaminase [Thainema sp.]
MTRIISEWKIQDEQVEWSDMAEPNPEFMQAAIALSLKSVRNQNGGPYGAVVVKDGKIIGQGSNQVAPSNDPTAHAEMMAIREACAHLGNFQLQGCELYTSCEPCPMCLGAIYWSRLDRIYYANTKEDAAKIGGDSQIIYDEMSVPLDQRKIPMIPLMREEATIAFEEWNANPDKVRY